MNNGKLSEKVAIVTGGTRGIGRSIVLALCREGAYCTFTYAQNKTLAESLAKEIEDFGGHAFPFQLDVRDFDSARVLVETVKNKFGRLDVLINNAGIKKDKNLMTMSREEWSSVIDTDLTGVFNTARACIITFLKQKSGNIINISSISGIHPIAGQVNYAAAKAGVIGFTKALAKEVAPFNVRVNAVAPGFIDTDMTSDFNEKYRKRLIDLIPAGRFGTTDEIARTVLFLLSEESGYITGEVIQVDGGLGLIG